MSTAKIQLHRFLPGLILLACLTLIVPGTVAAQDQPPALVRGYLFYSPTCEDCVEVRERLLPVAYQQFGQQLQIWAIDISNEANYRWWNETEKAYNIDTTTADVPELFIGDDALIGLEQIGQNLTATIQKYLDAGGVDYPAVPRPADAPLPTARFMFFYSPTCAHCLYVKENIFPRLEAQYGARVSWESHNVQDRTSFEVLWLIEEMAGMPEENRGSVPVVFIGDEHSIYSLFIGSGEIPAYLETTIDWFMGIGGVGFPAWKEELVNYVTSPQGTPATPEGVTATPEGTPATPEGPTATPSAADAATPTPAETVQPATVEIHLAYFGEVGCSECDRVTILLNYLKQKYPNLVIHELDIMQEDDLKINLCLADRLNVPDDQRHDAPAIFVGDHYLVDRDIVLDKLDEILAQYAVTGAPVTWADCDLQTIEFPPPPPWWAVIVPGLIDGINPCAFATIIFFVSYLSIIRRKGKDIIMVGIAFTLAVFLSYLAFGMILREVLAGLVGLVGPVLRPILNGLTALLCLVLAVLSFGDFRKAQKGNTKDMALQLPHKLRLWINKTIRTSMKAEALAAASFGAGVLVSFIELACTGQVYIPIIQGLSNPEYRLASTIALIVYCIAFVVPLIVVFIMSYLGTTSQQLTRVFDRYAAPVKLLMTLLFVGIGLWLIYDVLRIWGIISPLFTS
ncbi:MAG: hypothetical protein JW934_17365 [Anaerolineae bacterium]|nr:hypothetical protein [Anaerolineae bacterium]